MHNGQLIIDNEGELMKRFDSRLVWGGLFLTLSVLCFLWPGSSFGSRSFSDPRGSNDRMYETLRAVSTSDDTGPAAGDCNETAADALIDAGTAVRILGGRTSDSDEFRGSAEVTFTLTDATGETATWALYAIRTDGCPLEFVAYGTCTAGATVVDSAASSYYASAISITVGDKWLKSVVAIDGYQYNMGTGAVANGGVAKLYFDTCEYEYFVMYMAKGTCASMGAEVATFY